MCGRFTLKTPTATIGSLFPGLVIPDLAPRYNVAPTQNIACVRQGKTGKNELALLRWGLIPFWAKDTRIGAKMINARAETVAEKPSFRNAFKKRRCLVFADGYYEWKKENGGKQPYFITLPDAAPQPGFCLAGLWELWQDTQEQRIESCTIITTDAPPSLAHIHDRMPVIVQPDDFEFWLDADFDGVDRLQSVLKPVADGAMQATAVSQLVNSPRNDSPQCVVPIPSN